MKYKAKVKECQLIVSAKAFMRETIDEKTLDRFSRMVLRGFLKPQLVKKSLIQYTGPIGISFQERFKKSITKRDFLFIIEQVVVAVQKLRANNLELNGMIMDFNYVYINETTKEVQFLYVPTLKGVENSNVIEFIERIIYSAKPSEEADSEYVARFNYFFKTLKPFDIDRVESRTLGRADLLQTNRSITTNIMTKIMSKRQGHAEKP